MTDPVAIETVKLTAAYLNTATSGRLTTGVVAPFAAAISGVTGAAGPLSALTLAIGGTKFLGASLAAHAAARIVLMDLRP